MTSNFTSIADIPEEEKEFRLGLYENWLDGAKEKLDQNKRYKYTWELESDVIQRDELLTPEFKDQVKNSFLLHRHAGGSWEEYKLVFDDRKNYLGKTAWRFNEGDFNPDDLEATIRAELEDEYALKIESNYEPGSSIPDTPKYKIERELSDFDDDKNLTPRSALKKPSVKKFKIPKSVRNYAGGVADNKPVNTAKMAIKGLRKANKNPINKLKFN